MPLKLLKKILTSWLILNIIWLLLSSLPHARVHFLSWANHSLYSLLFLLALVIARRETYKKLVFISLSLYFFFHLVSIAPIFIGKNFLLGSNFQGYLFWLYTQIPVRFFGCLTVLLLVAHYTVPPRWRLACSIIIPLLTLTAAAILFAPYIATTESIRRAGWQASFYWRMLPFSLLPAVALIFYALRSYRYNRPDAIYLNVLAFQLFIIHFLNVVDFIANTHKVNVYGIDQYFLMGSLIALVMIMFMRLSALHSEKERYYERVVFDLAYLSHVPVLFHDRTLLRWWPLLRDMLNRSLAVHFIAGSAYLAFALFAGSFYTTFKLTLLVFWIGILIFLIDQRYSKSRTGIVLKVPQVESPLP